MSKREELKTALFDKLIAIVRDGLDVVTEGGAVIKVTAPANYLQAAIALLKVEDQAAPPLPADAGAVLRRLQKMRPGQPAAEAH